MRKQQSLIWAVTGLLVVMAMLLTSCAPAPTPTEAPPAPTEAPTQAAALEPTVAPTANPDFSPDIADPTEPVTITFASWVHTGEADDAWTVLAQQFHEIHPNITIEFQDYPAEEMGDKLLAQIAANNPPDSAYVDSGTVADFAQRTALVNLEQYIAKSKIVDKTDYVPAFLQAAAVNGDLYGLPIDGETTGLFYRTDRFQEAGIANPPATWDEFQQDAQKLTDKATKKYGYIVFAPEAAYYFYPWLWQAGADTLNAKDANDVIWDSPEGQAAANYYVNLVKYSPPDFLNSNSWDGRVAFANGDVAMYMAGAWFAGTLISEFPDATGKWASAPLPTKTAGGKCATTVASDDLVVFAQSKHPEAAYKWIEFVSAPDHMAMLNLGTPENPATLLPPRASLLNDPSLIESRPFLKGFVDNMKCAYVSDVVQPRYGEMESILNDYLGQAFYGKFDGATAVQKAAVDAEALLK